MLDRKTALGISLLKKASAASKAEALARGLKSVVVGSGDVGAAFAKGLGTSERVGRRLGQAGVAGSGYLGGRWAKRKYDEAKFRLLYGNQYY